MSRKRQTLMCDFETTTDPQDLRVWAVCGVNVDTLTVDYLGTELDNFMVYLSNKNTICYWHNLKFDGEFIIWWLLKNGFKYSDSKKDKTFQCLITDDGLFYSIEIVFHRFKSKKYHKVVIYDSLKKLPFKVAVIAKAFELQKAKGEIDYKATRPQGYELTDEEKEYIITDCQIVAEALKIQFAQGLTRMTNASDALNSYKNIVGQNTFEKWFPVLPLELDADLRRAYKGGYVYLNPKYKGVRGLQGITFDVNSLYPWAMYNCLLPYGYPVYFEGEPNPDDRYPLFIIHLKCCFELKPDHLPTIQLKNNRRFIETEYLTTSRTEYRAGKYENEPVEMWLTSVDYELMLDHYDITNMEYINGFKFKGAVGMFKDYIDYWMYIKETTTGALRQLAKLMLNSLYGKFATNPKTRKKVPYLDADEVVRYEYTEYEYRDPVYTAMGCFITAYAREKTIRSGQAVYDRFIYSDTDSLSLKGYDVPETLEVHPTHLGAWKNEGCFTDSKFIRAKTYMKTIDGVDHVTCAHLPRPVSPNRVSC